MNNLKETGTVVGLTVLLFVSGLITGIWTQRLQPSPPPPPPLREFGAGSDHREATGWSPEKVREMEARMERIRPQMEEFRGKLAALQDDYRKKILPLLTPEQQNRFNEIVARTQNKDLNHSHRDFYMAGMANFIGMVVFKPQLDYFSRELLLTPDQKSSVEKLLQQRRQDLLTLVDTTPPPSLRPMGD